MPFRVLPGDDASCLNLYEPRQPRILGVGHDVRRRRPLRVSDARWTGATRSGRIRGCFSNASSDDEAIPVIADANSMTYVLHRSLGDDIVINHAGRPMRLRLVAALADSIFQGELLMSEANFLKLFPEQDGYQFLLVERACRARGRGGRDHRGSPDRPRRGRNADRRAAGGVSPSREHLSLDIPDARRTGASARDDRAGGRAAAQRARAPPRAGAARRGRLRPLWTCSSIVIAESAFLLTCGLVAGAVCALVAIAPAAIDRGGRLPVGAGLWLLLFAVFGTGIVSSIVATKAAMQARLLEALRAE